MEFGLGSYGFGFLAGLLSTLSPCVLPLIPILIGSALNAHRRAPLALAGGLALSYAILGTAIAWLGVSAGIDTSIFRKIGAIVNEMVRDFDMMKRRLREGQEFFKFLKERKQAAAAA